MFRELLLLSNTGEYIEGRATGSFQIKINGGGTIYTITPDSAGKGRWDKPKDLVITNLASMFASQHAVTSIDKWTVDTSAVTNMMGMFSNCSNLTALDVSKFDTSNVMKMSYMFSGCYSLTSIDVSGFNTHSLHAGFEYMFNDCKLLKFVNMSNFEYTDSTTDFSVDYAFNHCTSLQSVNISKLHTCFENNSEIRQPNLIFGTDTPALEQVFIGDVTADDLFSRNMMKACHSGRPDTDVYIGQGFHGKWGMAIAGLRNYGS